MENFLQGITNNWESDNVYSGALKAPRAVQRSTMYTHTI